MANPNPVDILNATWAATLTGRDLMHYASTTFSTTETHAIFYSNGRINSSYEYYFSGDTGTVFSHQDYRGQWWVTKSGQDGATYWSDVAVYWYDSTDASAKGTSQTYHITTQNGADFQIGKDLYGSSLVADASGPGDDRLDSSADATLGPTLLGKEGNDTLTGNDAHTDQLFGGPGNDQLQGGGGDDRLYGQQGDDHLDGGAGVDVAIYFSAADQYTITQVAADAYEVADKSGTEGKDRLAGVEYLQFGGAAPVAIVSVATGSGQFITGTDGNDTLKGTGADETLTGLGGNDRLSGMGGADALLGGPGADRLDGGGGIDTLIGGTGNDTYVVDNAKDAVQETTASAAEIDTVESTVSWTLGAHLENLTLLGKAAINGTGNALNNLILANAGNNALKGGTGVDTVSYAQAATAVTVSLANQGKAQATGGSGSDTLSGFEKLTGSKLDDTLGGDGGDNTLRGGGGKDRLTGGGGKDTFVFDDAKADSLSDFASGTDRLALKKAALPVGDGDSLVEGAAVRAAPGGFAKAAELVIFTADAANAVDASSAAKAIGSAASAYAAGDHRLFAVDDGARTGLYYFTAADANAQVSPGELALVGILEHAPATTVGDYWFIA
jgi:Ca2+-binding RTX toxin-like protein